MKVGVWTTCNCLMDYNFSNTSEIYALELYCFLGIWYSCIVRCFHYFVHPRICSITLKAEWFAKGRGMTAEEPPNVGNSLNVLDKCTVCKGANLISMVWNFKGITCCNCLTRESINHCSVRSSCNFFPNAGIYFPSILSFFSFNLARSFERLIAAIFKNNKLVSHMFRH